MFVLEGEIGRDKQIEKEREEEIQEEKEKQRQEKQKCFSGLNGVDEPKLLFTKK